MSRLPEGVHIQLIVNAEDYTVPVDPMDLFDTCDGCQ